MPDDRSRLMTCFAAVFPALAQAEIPAASPETVAAWDSIAHVTLLAVVEEEFGVSVAAEDIAHVTSFSAILEYVGARAASTHAR